MAKKEPNMPGDVKTAPANETPEEQAAPVVEPLGAGGEAPAPELTVEEALRLSGIGDGGNSAGKNTDTTDQVVLGNVFNEQRQAGRIGQATID